MSKSPEGLYRNWLLSIRRDLRAAVHREAAENKRSDPAQIEIILCERYGIPVLTDADKEKARQQVRDKQDKVIPPRSRKGGTKTKNGTEG